MEQKTSKNILIADDHPLFVQGITGSLGEVEWIDQIFAAHNGQECLDLVEREDIDLVLLDINMPVKDGIACLSELRENGSEVAVIALSQFNERQIVKKMFRLGADGYLLKSSSEQEIIYALEDVLFRKKQVASDDLASELPSQEYLLTELPPRERMVLRLICDQLTAAQIAEKMDVSKNTVDNYRAKLMKRSNSRSLVGVVKWAFENGLI